MKARNTSSDVWSLGCVFLEMASTLGDRSPNDLSNFYRTHGARRNDFFALNSEATTLWVREIGSLLQQEDPKILEWIKWMLQEKMNDRPTPMQLRGRIIEDSKEEVYICPSCSSQEDLQDEKDIKEVTAQLTPVTASDLGRPERQEEPQHLASPANHHLLPGETSESTAQKKVRYSLPEDGHHLSTSVDTEQGAYINPSTVTSPPFLKKDSIPLPTATLVPSYILAGTNHLSNTEFEDLHRYNPLAVNLFVYGRLMFPSILHSIAANSVNGVYAPKLRRRLFPSTGDWGRADISIKSACDNMTPAKLRGYDRWRPRGLNCAVAQEVRLTRRILEQSGKLGHSRHGAEALEPPGSITGFLVLGLRSDALRYCDLLFLSDEHTLWRMTPPKDDDDENADSDSDSSTDSHASPLLQRRRVKVDVELDDGTIRTVDADTYIWSRGTKDLVDVWNEDRFVRSTCMQNLLTSRPNWTREEQQLALKMNMSLALVGDYLCSAIVSGDIQALAGLLDNNHFSPDSPCRVYGLPLQAAIIAGRDDMVRLLISQNAKLDAPGGDYGTPLVAAAIYGRIAITKTLLHHGADVLASDPVHVNALYQAVSHANYALTEMLLEHSAWLSQNWREILDLADSLGPDGADIRILLSAYDVRGRTRPNRRRRALLTCGPDPDSHRRRRNDSDGSLVRQRESCWDLVNYSEVGLAVLRKFGTVAHMPYNWKGRRAVELTVAALNAGAPLELITLIRNAIHPVKAILEMLRQSDSQHGRSDIPVGSLREIRDVEEVSEGESESDQEHHSRSRQHNSTNDSVSMTNEAQGDEAIHVPTQPSEFRFSHSHPSSHRRQPPVIVVEEEQRNSGRRAGGRATSVPRRDTTYLAVPESGPSSREGQLRRSVSARERTSPRYRVEQRTRRGSGYRE